MSINKILRVSKFVGETSKIKCIAALVFMHSSLRYVLFLLVPVCTNAVTNLHGYMIS